MNTLIKDSFGLAITNEALVAIDLSLKKGGVQVSHFFSVALPPGTIEDQGVVANSAIFKEKLKELISQFKANKFQKRNVILSFSESKVFSHHLMIKKAQMQDVPKIHELAKDFIPIDLKSAIIDYQSAGLPDEEGRYKVNVVATQKSVVSPLIEALAEVGLKVLFVDVHSNGLIRLCRQTTKEGGLCVVNIGAHETLMVVQGEGGWSFGGHIQLSGEQWIKDYKKEKGEALSKVHEGLFKPDFSKSKTLAKGVKNFTKELSQFLQVVQKQLGSAPKAVFLTGPYAQVAGFLPLVKATFPRLKVDHPLATIQFTQGQVYNYPEVVGSALLSVIPFHLSAEINLSPLDRKNELDYFLLTPMVQRILSTVSVLFLIMTLFLGYRLANDYIRLKVSRNEVQLSLERAESPYLLSQARQTQEQTQLKNQIDQILNSNLPYYQLIKKMTSFNSSSVQMISVSFNLTRDPAKQVIRFRANVQSRADTEVLIARLEADPYFEKVISPLANLTGKGERFVNIELEISPEKLIEMIEMENEEGNEPVGNAPRSPNLPSNPASPSS